MTGFEHRMHARTRARLAGEVAPVRVEDQHSVRSVAARFNTRLALLVTRVVGSMWCAYGFAAFDCISLPSAIRGGASTIVSWIAQTFLQLVLLSIIMVGQNVQGAASDKRSEATWHDADATLHELVQVQEHMAAQDRVLDALAERAGLPGVGSGGAAQ